MSAQSRSKEKTPWPQKPIVIIITIVLAAAGGFPGLWTLFIDGPKFIYVNEGTLIAPFYNDADTAHEHTCFVVVGTIANSGTKPLFPKLYEARIIDKNNNIDYPLQANIVDTAIRSLHIKGYKYSFDSLPDLAYVDKISATDAVHGLLSFLYPEPLKTDLSGNWTLEITCIDIYGKKYTQQFPLKEANPFLPKVFPHTGLRITPDSSIHFSQSK